MSVANSEVSLVCETALPTIFIDKLILDRPAGAGSIKLVFDLVKCQTLSASVLSLSSCYKLSSAYLWITFVIYT